MPDSAGFPWRTDVGTSSIAGIEALAKSSGVPFSVTSTYRPGDPGYHGSQNAVDMASTTENMAGLASYLYQYSVYLLELIHSDHNADGGGWFVKNGRRVDAAYYGPDIVTQHYNHVHCATTNTALQSAAQGTQIIPAARQVTEKAGCLAHTAAALLIPFLTLGGLLWMIH